MGEGSVARGRPGRTGRRGALRAESAHVRARQRSPDHQEDVVHRLQRPLQPNGLRELVGRSSFLSLTSAYR